MVTQPQPVYHNELGVALDRLFAKVATYVDDQNEKLLVQARLFNQDSINRDHDAMHRDQELVALLLTYREESRKQTEMLLQDMNALHGEAMEAINELKKAVNELQQKDDQ